MTLTELYQATPVAQHGNIKVRGDRVFVVAPEGTEEYLLSPGGEVELLHSDKELRQNLRLVRAKLGA